MQQEHFKFIFTTVLGNIIEWYDFALYGYFATIFSKLFFPSQSAFFSLLMTFGAFATGFIARPLGGILFGYIGDRYGRRLALLISISLIIIPTAVIGILPTYATVGMAAPLLLTCCRILQGIAVSGELTGSGVFLLECAAVNSRGFYGSLIMCSTYLGLLLGAAICMLTSYIFDETSLTHFAWRIPFIFSFILGIVSIFLRLKCQESPVFLALKLANGLVKKPISQIIKHYTQPTLLVMCLSNILAVVIYLLIGYFPSYFTINLNMNINQAMAISAIGLFVLSLSVPLVGSIVDKYGHYKIFTFGAFLFLFCSPFLFELLVKGQLLTTVLCVSLTALFLAPIAATIIYIITDIFPQNIRCSGVSMGYNLSMSIFGGTTPLIALVSRQYFKIDQALAFYVSACALLSLVAMYFLRKKHTYISPSHKLTEFN